MGKHRIVLARSGVQYYLRGELPGMGVTSVPKEFDDLSVFGVYRPAEVLRRVLPKLVHTPVVDGHDKVVVTGTEPYVLGYCGDKPAIRYQNGELVATSDFDIEQEELMPKYRELSLGYVGRNRWAPGVTKDGVPYQLMCDEIEHVEHLAFVPRARGGSGMRVLDGVAAMAKKMGNSLRALVYKKNGLTLDEATSWDDIITQLKSTEGLNENDVELFTNGLIGCLDSVENSEEKSQLLRYLADLPVLYDEPHDIWVQTVDTVDSLYKSITGGTPMNEESTQTEPTQTPPEAQTAPSSQPTAEAPIDKVLNTLVSVVDKLTDALAKVNAPPPETHVEQTSPVADNPVTSSADKPTASDTPKDAEPPSGDAVTKDDTVTKDSAAPEVVVVTKGDVVTENEAVATTEVPPAAGGAAEEQVMVPEGVVTEDTGALRNQAESATCPECGTDPCTCPTDPAPQTTVVNVNIPPFTGDAMPAINMQAPSVSGLSSLDEDFLRMKGRR